MSGKNFKPKDQRIKGVISPRPRANKIGKLVFSKIKLHAFSYLYLFLCFAFGSASLTGHKQHLKVPVWIFSEFVNVISTQNKVAECRAKFNKSGKRKALEWTKFLKKKFQKNIFV